MVHPQGPHQSRESPEAAARREFAEEVGAVPPGPLTLIGELKLSGSKRLIAYALEGDFDPAALVSNSFEMEWPPRSGRKQTFPEVDRAQWFTLIEAQSRLHLGQRPLLGLFTAWLATPPASSDPT